MLSDEVDEGRLQLDHLLARTRAGGLDISRDGEGTGSEVHGGERLARHPELIDDSSHARDVLEVQMRRIVEVDVRLRRSVDDELEAGREVRGGDAGDGPVREPRLRLFARDRVALWP